LQLLHKTNQFNTTARRYDEGQLDALINDGGEVIVLGAEDKFNPKENIGLLIVRWNCPEPNTITIDTYLLSCRVLGKGMETGALQWLKAYAADRQCSEIYGCIIETERNLPVRGIYREAGFEPGQRPGEWVCRLDRSAENIPSWLTVIDNVSRGMKTCRSKM
jgi:FkbH-like protein